VQGQHEKVWEGRSEPSVKKTHQKRVSSKNGKWEKPVDLTVRKGRGVVER